MYSGVGQLQICYVDESGSGEALLPTSPPDTPPILALVGVIIDQGKLATLTRDFVALKRRFHPNLVASGHLLDWVLGEVKGKDLRASLRRGSRNEIRAALGFIDHVLRLLEANQARIVGRVWVKNVGTPCNESAMYTFSIQDSCVHFQNYLALLGEEGLVLCDSRTKSKNTPVAHSIFTQKFRAAGDPFSRIIEMPTFGHSDNHVGLQLADAIVSALLFPIAARVYCSQQLPANVHTSSGYDILKVRFGQRLERLQYRYKDLQAGRWRGGVVLSDQVAGRSGRFLFR